MSKRTICAGCGISEESGSEKLIQPVRITVGDTLRSWEQQEVHVEDLCDNCVAHILRDYFGVKPEGFLTEVPVRPIGGAA